MPIKTKDGQILYLISRTGNNRRILRILSKINRHQHKRTAARNSCSSPFILYRRLIIDNEFMPAAIADIAPVPRFQTIAVSCHLRIIFRLYRFIGFFYTGICFYQVKNSTSNECIHEVIHPCPNILVKLILRNEINDRQRDRHQASDRAAAHGDKRIWHFFQLRFRGRRNLSCEIRHRMRRM